MPRFERKSYDLSIIAKACFEARSKNMSFTEVSKKYKIPSSCIKYHYYKNSDTSEIKKEKITHKSESEVISEKVKTKKIDSEPTPKEETENEKVMRILRGTKKNKTINIKNNSKTISIDDIPEDEYLMKYEPI